MRSLWVSTERSHLERATSIGEGHYDAVLLLEANTLALNAKKAELSKLAVDQVVEVGDAAVATD